MAEPKTRRTGASVADFIAAVPNERRRRDARTVQRIMEQVTGEKAEMWGPTIVGFGAYTYSYASGKALQWPIAGFSPRSANLVVYIMPGFTRYDELLGKLGKHKHGKSCLYLNSLDDVDVSTLESLVRESVAHMRAKYPADYPGAAPTATAASAKSAEKPTSTAKKTVKASVNKVGKAAAKKARKTAARQPARKPTTKASKRGSDRRPAKSASRRSARRS